MLKRKSNRTRGSGLPGRTGRDPSPFDRGCLSPGRVPQVQSQHAENAVPPSARVSDAGRARQWLPASRDDRAALPQELPPRLIEPRTFESDVVPALFCNSGTTFRTARRAGRCSMGDQAKPRSVQLDDLYQRRWLRGPEATPKDDG